jgi:PAS domain S-box-containing protein
MSEQSAPGAPPDLARLAELLPYPALLAARDGSVVQVNRRWQDLTGLDGEQSAGDGWLTALDAGDRPGVAAAWRAAVASNTPLERQTRLAAARRWWLVQASAIEDAQAAAGWIISLLDIDRQRRVEESLHATEERLRVAVASAPVIVYSQDRDLRYIAIQNPLPGFAEVDVLGKTDHDLMLPDEAETLTKLKRGVMATGQGARADVVVTSMVGEVAFDLVIEPLRDDTGAIIGVTGVSLDISERRRVAAERDALLAAEQTARANAELAQQRLTLLAGASRAFSAQAMDARAIAEAVARYTGETVGDGAMVRLLSEDGGSLEATAIHLSDPVALALLLPLVGRSVAIEGSASGRVHSSLQPYFIREIDIARLPAAVRVNLEPLLDHFEPVSIMGVPLRAGARALGVLIVLRNKPSPPLTDEDLLLVQEIADRAALSIRHAQLYAGERRALAEAQEALTARDDFLATVSHDLKTPLTTIYGLVQLAQRQVARLEAPTAQPLTERLRRIQAAATRMSAMIGGLLDLSMQMQGHGIDLDLAQVDLAVLVERCVREAQSEHPDRTLTLAIGDERFDASCDPARIERVLNNLISNALKYSAAQTPIAISLVREDGAASMALLAVSDSGVGIPAADLPHVFERFYRGSNVRGRFGGTGIGLAGVKQTVEQHGGSASVESIEGTGTTIRIRLLLLQ